MHVTPLLFCSGSKPIPQLGPGHKTPPSWRTNSSVPNLLRRSYCHKRKSRESQTLGASAKRGNIVQPCASHSRALLESGQPSESLWGRCATQGKGMWFCVQQPFVGGAQSVATTKTAARRLCVTSHESDRLQSSPFNLGENTS